MREIYSSNNELNSLEKPKLEPHLAEKITELSEKVPEIAEKYDLIASHATVIVEALDIQDEFFASNNVNDHLTFIALAHHLATGLDHAKTEEEATYIIDFVANSARLVAWEHADNLEGLKQELGMEGHNYETVIATFERHTDIELTVALQTTIDRHDLLEPIRQRLGLTEETENPFRVIALDIDSNKETPESHAWLEDFQKGVNVSRPLNACTQKLKDGHLIALSKEIAQDIIKTYANHDPARRKSITPDVTRTLEHEYVHCQKDIGNALGDLNIFEELRATYFSRGATYSALRNIDTALELLTGYSIKEELAKTHTQDDPHQFLYGFINHFGLERTLRLSSVYNCPTTNEYEARLSAYAGNYDTILAELYEDIATDPQLLAAATQRLRKFFIRNCDGSPKQNHLYNLPTMNRLIDNSVSPEELQELERQRRQRKDLEKRYHAATVESYERLKRLGIE
jgi:hypothetical protein